MSFLCIEFYQVGCTKTECSVLAGGGITEKFEANQKARSFTAIGGTKSLGEARHADNYQIHTVDFLL